MIHVGVRTGAGTTGRGVAVGCPAVLLLLVWSGMCAAQINNPSFEVTYEGLPWPRPLPLYWARVDHSSFNSYCTDFWSTDGGLSACLFSVGGRSFLAGQYQSFRQPVDLTGVDVLAFDALLTSDPVGPFAHFEASFLIGGVPVWSEIIEGEYLHQQVNVSGLEGWHMIEMRITAIESGTFGESYWALWDNVQLLQGFAAIGPIEAVIDLDPDTLNLASRGKWITCYIELEDGYDAAEIDGATVTLAGLSAHLGKEGWAQAGSSPRNVADRDGDGIPERMVKFDRAAVQAIVQPPEATLAVSGLLLDGTPFEGVATVRVIAKQGQKK